MSQLEFKNIRIENFKTFRGSMELDLARKPGLYYITGKNLAHPELGANGVGKSTIWDAMFWCLWGKTIRDNRPANAIVPWTGKGATEVSLTFYRNGAAIDVVRTRSPNSLKVGDLTGLNEVQQDEIPKVIGMSEEMFRRTLILGQFGTLFLDLKPEAQAAMFNEALDLEMWTRARQVASEEGTRAERFKTTKAAELSAGVQVLEDIARDMQRAEEQSNLFEEDKAARIRKIEQGIKILESDLEKLQESPALKPNLPDTSKSNAAQDKIAKVRESARDIARDIMQAARELKDLEEAVGRLQRQSKLDTKTCPTCKQEIDTKEYKRQLAELTESMEKVCETAKELDAKASRLQDAKAKLEDELEDALAAELSSKQNYNKALNAFTDYEASLKASRAELQRQRTALKEAQGQANHHEASLADLRTKRARYRASQGELKEKIALADQEIANANFWADGFREIRLSIIDQTLVELEMAASRHMGMLGLEGWGIKFETERETTSGKVSHTFTVLLYPPGQDEAVRFESYSGGESQRLQLAVSFGLSEVLLSRAGLSPNFEVLDEPTRGLSADGVADLLDHLRNRALELGRAIYFVDHHSLDKGAFDGTLVITKDKKGSTFAWQ